jgi:hypothetical protein
MTRGIFHDELSWKMKGLEVEGFVPSGLMLASPDPTPADRSVYPPFTRQINNAQRDRCHSLGVFRHLGADSPSRASTEALGGAALADTKSPAAGGFFKPEAVL